jgi:hypothetical protein
MPIGSPVMLNPPLVMLNETYKILASHLKLKR